MKKIIPLLLVLGLTIGTSGCGNTSPNTGTNTNTNLTTSEPIKMGRIEYAAHGTQSFTVAVAAVQGDKIVGASIDDYQFMPVASAKGVPNSDVVDNNGLGSNYKDPKTNVLASKRINNEYYSKNMKDKAKATKGIADNYDAIEKYVTGKTISELEKVLADNDKDKMVDVVSSATLADTKGYVTAIVEAAKAAK